MTVERIKGRADGERKHPPLAAAGPDVLSALRRGAANLIRHQGADGDWEGETVWCAMLPAQYAIMCHVTGTVMTEERRRRVLLQFRSTQLPSGLWGLHEHSEPYLFTTALVYVAARLLGVEAGDPMLAAARDMFEREGGIAKIPSWGKLWLALVGLYEWDGVNPILPEAWALPRAVPLHPSNYYCHTRLIYMGMAALYGRRLRAPRTPLVDALRSELYPRGYHKVDWARARHQLREGDLYERPGWILRTMYDACRVYDRVHSRKLRRTILADISERIRWELRTTDHTCLSPVNGMVSLIALWADDPDDPDFKRGIERFEGWIWEDDVEGTRVAGARSASWDSAFAVQALTAAFPHADVMPGIGRGVDFLLSQQIKVSFPGWQRAYRVDPKGGWCFAGVWHGWPVSDCTAEALIALLEAPGTALDRQWIEQGVRFLLQAQNHDGGFGSYEPRKHPIGLEWLNPAEMFGDSMTELSYIECSASNLTALALFRRRYPESTLRPRVDRAIARAHRFLRERQNEDGTWDGAWGVWFIYGTMFGVRGLLAAGTPNDDPAIRRACRWLLERQREDGGWGEDVSVALSGSYREAEQSHAIQTAWAITTLCEAGDPDGDAIERGAAYLARVQEENGDWPHQGMVGVFFHTALLDYRLYRRIFPVQALGLVEARRRVEAAASRSEDHGDRHHTAAARA